MIDLKHLREAPDHYREGCRKKNIRADIDRILALDEQRRGLQSKADALKAEQNRIAKESGPLIGKLQGALKSAAPGDKARLESELAELKAKPARLKEEITGLDARASAIEPELNGLLLAVPLPPDADVPVGAGSEDNVQVRVWNPPARDGLPAFDPSKSFESQRGFKPRTHLELIKSLGLVDFERGVKIAGSRSYVLTGDGMRLHNAVLQFAFDFITRHHGFRATSVPVVVREETMVGTGFFPGGREQAYHIEESKRGSSHDLFLTGTGEVGLMALHMDEILDESQLPLKYATVSTCFRREAGAAGKDTAGLYRIHQFDKVEQVVICRADEKESREWHARMIGIVEQLLQTLGLPYRLLQCCTGDLGAKNADMIDIESWMPGRGEVGKDGTPSGAYGETHSASRLYDFQCRRLNLRYRPAGSGEKKGAAVFCHSLNNTVLASPRVLIPILENYQNEDGTVTVPGALRAFMGGQERIG